MKKKPMVLMIEDDGFFQNAWKTSLGDDVIFKTFSNPFEFEEAVDKDDLILAADCIIVDFDFGNENAGEIGIVDFLKSKRYEGKILLCSVHDKFGEYDSKIRKDFNVILSKKPLSWKDLSKALK